MFASRVLEEIGVARAYRSLSSMVNILSKRHPARYLRRGVVARSDILHQVVLVFCTRKEGPWGSGLTICKHQMMEWAKDVPLSNNLMSLIHSSEKKFYL